jgi:hypothetical protein
MLYILNNTTVIIGEFIMFNSKEKKAAKERNDSLKMHYVDINCKNPLISMKRAFVPGGWFVASQIAGEWTSLFYPDPNHEWQVAD